MLLRNFVNSSHWPAYFPFGGARIEIKSVEPDNYSKGRFKIRLVTGQTLTTVHPDSLIHLEPAPEYD